jgi:hypothetical protein
MTTCYKVASTKRDKSSGFESTATFEPYSVDYKIGEVTVPNIEGTPLFVFDTLEHAEFYKTSNFCSILECEYDQLFHVQNVMYHSICYESTPAQDMVAFWNGIKADEVYNEPPVGTLLVCSVRVIREIEDGN